jgi:hypothetical protein
MRSASTDIMVTMLPVVWSRRAAGESCMLFS